MCRYFHVWQENPLLWLTFCLRIFPLLSKASRPAIPIVYWAFLTGCLIWIIKLPYSSSEKLSVQRGSPHSLPLPVVGTSTRWVIGRKCAHGLWYPQGPWLPDSPVDCWCFPSGVSLIRFLLWNTLQNPCLGFHLLPEMLLLQSHILDIIYRSSVLNHISNHIFLKSF